MYPEEDDDDDSSMFSFLGNSKPKKKIKLVQAIFAYIDRVDHGDSGISNEFATTQSMNDKIKLIGTVFQKQWESVESDNDQKGFDKFEEVNLERDYFNFSKLIDVNLEHLEQE